MGMVTMPAYEPVVFMQGDDANEPLDILYNREPGHTFPYYLGPTAESIAAAVAYLAQWDYGEPAEASGTPSCGTAGDVWEQDGYLMSASLGYGHIGLERIVTA